MNKFFIIFFLVAKAVLSQGFEGKITYKNDYVSKSRDITSEQLNILMGTLQEYIISKGNYKNTFNGKLNEYQLYRLKENKIYTKFSNKNTLYWSDGGIEGEAVVDLKIKEKKEIILGIVCDEIIMKTNQSIYKYYYNSKYSIDPKLFENHLFGNWYIYVKKSKSIPLKIVLDTPEFESTSIAIKIEDLDLSDSLFYLPKLELKPITDFGK